MAKKILFLVPYPLHQAPSQRFRFEQYFDVLKKNGYNMSVQSFLDSHNWQLFFEVGRPIFKAIALVNGFFKRFIILFKIPFYSFIFIHREAAPIGPPVFEWIIIRLLRRKVIYDFDDAIWQTDRKEESALFRISKWRSKVKKICQWSFKVSCGNRYLCSYALQFNKNVVFNPTTVDTEFLHNPELFPADEPDSIVTIGWTGTHTTLKYLNLIEPVLQKLEREFSFLRIMIIANQKPALKLKSLIFKEWDPLTEIKDLLHFDIGVMPLPNEEWSRGKCGFKILQYLAMKIPAVASPVGVNISLIRDNINGYLCASEDDWYSALKKLIENKTDCKVFGANGREFVRAHYSSTSNSSNFLCLFFE